MASSRRTEPATGACSCTAPAATGASGLLHRGFVRRPHQDKAQAFLHPHGNLLDEKACAGQRAHRSSYAVGLVPVWRRTRHIGHSGRRMPIRSAWAPNVMKESAQLRVNDRQGQRPGACPPLPCALRSSSIPRYLPWRRWCATPPGGPCGCWAPPAPEPAWRLPPRARSAAPGHAARRRPVRP